MKVYIYRDERWPDYGFSTSGNIGDAVEVEEDLFNRVKAAEEEYGEVQRILHDLYVLAKPPEPVLPKSEEKNIQLFRYPFNVESPFTTVRKLETESVVS